MMINTIPNAKERVRARRNFVAKNDYHKGGFHTPAKYSRRRKYRNDWKEDIIGWTSAV